jgi:RNA polymerase sigma factor (sigma-70 family)
MSKAQLGTVLRYLQDVTATHQYVDCTDRELLQAFLVQEDQAAFSALVKRHGPLVLAVCRRMLPQVQDSEDAFQATFLLLVRQAASIRKPESLASWLHGVAYRMSRNLQRAAARRRKHESQAQPKPSSNPSWTAAWQEVQILVDEETQRLPTVNREAFILCCLENQSSSEVARTLGQKEATIRSRVARARQLLQKRLAKRGVSLVAVMSTAALGTNSGTAGVPAPLVVSTVKAALAYAQGNLGVGIISAEVVALVQGATKALAFTKLQVATALVLALSVGVGTAGLGVLRHPVLAGPGIEAEPPSGNEAQANRPPVRVFDAFDGHYLANWQPVRFDPSHVSLTKHPGQLTITTQHGSIYEDPKARGEPPAKNLFVMDNPAGADADFVLTTSISDFTPTAAYQQAALLCYDNDENYVKWSYEYNHDKKRGQKLNLVRETDNHAAYVLADEVSGLKRMWLRLTKRGQWYEFAASADGRKFMIYGEKPWGGSAKRIGIVAKNGGRIAPEIDARFDFFEFCSPAPPREEDDGDAN